MRYSTILILFLFLGFQNIVNAQDIEQLKTQIENASGAQKAAYQIQLANYLMDDEPKEAFVYAQQGTTLAESEGQVNLAANGYAVLGNVSLVLKKYNDAIDYAKKALPEFKDTEVSTYANCLTVIADAYQAKGENKQAASYNTKAFKEYISVGKNKQAAYCASSAGKNYNDLGKTYEAAKWYEKASTNFSKAGKHRDASIANRTIGVIWANYGDYEKAVSALRKAQEIASNFGYEDLVQDLNGMLSQVEQNKTNESNAVSDFQKEKDAKQDEIMLDLESRHSKSLEQIESLSEELQLAALKKKALADEARIHFLEKERVKDSLNVTLELKEESDARAAAEKEADAAKLMNLIYIVAGVVIVLLVSIIGLLRVRKANSKLKDRNQKIIAQKEKIELQRDDILKKSENIQQSIDYATRIQQAVLPSPNRFTEVINNSFIVLKPKDNVSGDFFWYHHDGDELIIVAADCTGHGVPGAFMSIIFSTLLDKVVLEDRNKQPNAILEAICTTLTSKLLGKNLDNSDFKDGMDVAVVHINRSTKKMLYSGARNPAYLVREEQLVELKGTRRSVGVLKEESKKPFELLSVDVIPGDRIYMFSDGFPDQKGGPNGKKYYYQPFKDLLVKLSSKKMSDYPKEISQEFLKWKGDKEQFDDVLIVGVEID